MTRFGLDRSLPVPLGIQLLGKIKYGIACGELRPGERLPSVREMAAQVGLAPMTVANVYRELQGAELIEARPGSGTFVAQGSAPDARRQRGLRRMQAQIDALLREAEALGLDAAALVALVNMRASQARAGGLRLVLVGLFEAATEDYAATIRARLPAQDSIAALTLDRLCRDPASRASAMAADLVLTLTDRRTAVASLLGPGSPPIVALRFLPAEHVRTRLASLDPFTRVAIVSLFPEWLAIMTAGVERFAPHVSQVAAAVLGAANLPEILTDAELVVYATGAEAVLQILAEGTAAIEYRHSPDPSDIETRVLRVLDTLRQRTAAPAAEEASCE